MFATAGGVRSTSRGTETPDISAAWASQPSSVILDGRVGVRRDDRTVATFAAGDFLARSHCSIPVREPQRWWRRVQRGASGLPASSSGTCLKPILVLRAPCSATWGEG